MSFRNRLCLPVLGSFLGGSTLELGVVKDLSLHATQLSNVLAEVAGDELLTAGGVGEAGMGQGLTMGTNGFGIGAAEAVNLGCKGKSKSSCQGIPGGQCPVSLRDPVSSCLTLGRLKKKVK